MVARPFCLGVPVGKLVFDHLKFGSKGMRLLCSIGDDWPLN